MSSSAARMTTIALAKEYMKFSAAHFTIFSATERERLHGHNFRVFAEIDAPVNENGMCFSYNIYKQKIQDICDSLDEYTILQGDSPFLQVSQGDENFYFADFNNETLHFLKADTLVLPLKNTTVEEFSFYILNKMLEDSAVLEFGIQRIQIRVSSGDGQSGSSEWVK